VVRAGVRSVSQRRRARFDYVQSSLGFDNVWWTALNGQAKMAHRKDPQPQRHCRGQPGGNRFPQKPQPSHIHRRTHETVSLPTTAISSNRNDGFIEEVSTTSIEPLYMPSWSTSCNACPASEIPAVNGPAGLQGLCWPT